MTAAIYLAGGFWMIGLKVVPPEINCCLKEKKNIYILTFKKKG